MSAVAEVDLLVDAPASTTLNLIDEQNPWLGLDSFSEETRQFFHGREEEVAELARRVQRKTLAILFGQSGLGKTSILRAGIVPRLRREGYCPVYVRIDYARESPSPSQQIKQAIFRATEGAGRWTKAGSAVPGESLWEFLHHRDDFLEDAQGRPLTPLLIFDQFEEIFTLGQDDDFGRQRAAEFIDDLADLVENRPPKALEVMLESEDSIIDRFDFERADYRVLIALREDYLAHLEGLKATMPSITQNRMRLARMTGQQALTAVTKPGGRLVTEEVAEAIVRFVAGGSELRNAEVEPSLLSLVCRELNNTRIAQGRAEISADLLAGSRDTILHEFYERALTDQPEGVRRFIEDEMLTESGFRESLGEERVLRAFAAAGAAPNALATLVNRRLLRIEERLDLRRVELTHDVLCPVVAESREVRHEREAKEEAERQLEAQKAREAATRKALVRARQVAFGCAVLAIVALAGGIFGWYNMTRARDAEAQANSTRSEAEKLVVYLIDDFYLELAPIGRLDTVADLAKRAIDYYTALPLAMRTPEAERNRAIAQVRYGYALAILGKLDDSEKQLGEAIGTLQRLRNEGDTSELAAIGLGLGFAAKARLMLTLNRNLDELKAGEEGAKVLQPLMTQPKASARLSRAYGDVMTRYGFAQMRSGAEAEGAKNLGLAREAYRSIDDLKLGDLGAAAAYAEASAWHMEALDRQGKTDEARSIGEEAAKVAAQVLERRPGHMAALRSHALLVSALSASALNELHLRKALDLERQAEADYLTFVRLDPGNTLAWNNLAGTRVAIGQALDGLGRSTEALAAYQSILDIVAKHVGIRAAWVGMSVFLAQFQAEYGARRQELIDYRKVTDADLAQLPGGSFERESAREQVANAEREIELAYGEYRLVLDEARRAITRIKSVKPTGEGQARQVAAGLATAHKQVALTSYYLGDFATAEAEMRVSIQQLSLLPIISLADKANMSEHRLLLAQAIARQGRQADAAKLVAPELEFNRNLVQRGSEDLRQHAVLARALLASAQSAAAERKAHLAEAAKIVDGFPAEMTRRKTIVRLRSEIADEAKR